MGCIVTNFTTLGKICIKFHSFLPRVNPKENFKKFLIKYFDCILIVFFLPCDLRKGPANVPLKFNALDTTYNTDRKSYIGEYEVVQGVPR